MVDNIENRILIREFNEDRDIEEVEKLEKNCEIGSKRGISIFTNMMGDPLCRIRLYPVHVMLVAELLQNGELVGVVRGCIKYVGTGFMGAHVKMGCILGLRVSPRHRRMGIGLKLVKSIEEWTVRNGAHYIILATEESNIPSKNLFTVKCNYSKFISLVIVVQPVSSPTKHLCQDIKIEKLHTDQAISFYENRFGGKEMYPMDIDAILKGRLSLGTWISYFKEGNWNGEMISSTRTPSSWVIFSIWNSCEVYKLQIRKSLPLKCFHATLSHARDKIFPCLKMPIIFDSFENKPFGFLFLYGLYGEGERLAEIMKCVWSFASRMAENVKDCRVIMAELGASDPLRWHVPQGSSMSTIKDLWYLKKVCSPASDEDELMMMGQVGDMFVDPRDF
ncbi:probable N-acetyltransferase HLS1 [Malania oleifera]|uniref:probable N-acetyltransferase HLS1 n=1 Tax=Malania oleifera TaxID=397392 RepID=UPI0025AE49F9|nr:probable N-acetyltransferase HLS1 [Malania oleifera]